MNNGSVEAAVCRLGGEHEVHQIKRQVQNTLCPKTSL